MHMAVRAFRSDDGMISLSSDTQVDFGTLLLWCADTSERVESLVGWAPYTGLYRVTDAAGLTSLWAVVE
jgi:hypothetical protein